MILITGAAGFIGMHAVRRLLDDNANRVRVLLQESEKELATNFTGAEVVVGDLNDGVALGKATSGVDTVVHLAGKNIDADGTGFHHVNVEGTERLCEAAVRAGVKSFLYLSTVGVYGHRRHRDAYETTPVRPDTAFSRSKAEAEGIVRNHHKDGDFQGIILRHRFVYGEGDVHVVARMIRSIIRYPLLIGGGRARISLILADELAEIISRFVREKISRVDDPVYHVTDGAPISYEDIVGILGNEYGLSMPTRSMPFWSLYFPVWLREKMFRIDPETSKSSLSSMRLKLVGLDNYFSNRKLMARFPDLVLTPFREAFPRVAAYYRRFVETKPRD